MAAAGWYNDESDRELARWHDGVGWTDHVVVKAEWEARGHPPPPPEDREPYGPAPSSRLRTGVGSAAVLALLLVGGVALAQDGGDEPSGDDQTEREADPAAGKVPDVTYVVDPVSIPSTSAEVDDTDESTDASETGNSGARSTVRTTAPTTVRRTETATRTQTNPAPRTSVVGGDKESVGNTSSKTIQDGYVPPPSTAPPETTTTVAAETTTTASTAPPIVGTPPETP